MGGAHEATGSDRPRKKTMTFFTELGTKGIGIGFGFGQDGPPRLRPSGKADQNSPRRYYVYGHFDKNETPFYIGKGTERRAWDTDRHHLWHRYLDKHLGGEYLAVILEDDLTSDEAEELESQWVSQESDTLVNWVNYGRVTDFEALDRFHILRDKNRALAAKAKGLEKKEIGKAISLYQKAFQAIYEYAIIQPDKGLVGQLLDEEREEEGIKGDIEILDRLTLCLCRCKRHEEAIEAIDKYFHAYRVDLASKRAERLLKRIQKLKKK